MSLINKKVKIKVDNYNKKELSPMFIKFLNESKDKIFTAQQEKKYKGTDIYILEEEPMWTFYVSNLEVVKFAGKL